MQKLLKNNLKNNKLYSDGYHGVKNKSLNFDIYTNGLSASEERAVKRIIIAILEKKNLDILKLHGKGLTQKCIAKKLSISQTNVSVRLKKIKTTLLKESFNKIIEYII